MIDRKGAIGKDNNNDHNDSSDCIFAVATKGAEFHRKSFIDNANQMTRQTK